MDTNTPETFGSAVHCEGEGMTVLSLLHEAPVPAPARNRPAVKRLLQGDGANLIVFKFAPGQQLPDHKAAHPITVQCVQGQLEFGCNGGITELVPGVVCHLNAYVPHSVVCPEKASGEAILLLTMLTGEKH